jgi:predicted dehydrogenase/threonine dehydrogenase-like Zn-dependent dehydrogenase
VKQVTQRLRNGRIEIVEVPVPHLTETGVLVDVRASLLSAGTERSKIEGGRKSLIGKARARPEQARAVLDSMCHAGIAETVRAVRVRLDQPSALGYSAAGIVLAVGAGVRDLLPGDRVACGGGDYAVHAEIDHVPGNLCVALPDQLDFAAGAFATVGSIALHGVRQADAKVGERVAVIGLGLVGQLTAQILRAAGCHVVGIDVVPDLVERSRALGSIHAGFVRDELDDRNLPREAQGCDAVIVTAATMSADPMQLAPALCRDRGRVVVVGDVGLELPRAPYYEKEIEIRTSRSYGPGRYDREYEERGLDYPIGYVRWTERRNMVAFLDLVARGLVGVQALITARVPVERAIDAYKQLLGASRSPLGIVIDYEASAQPGIALPVRPTTKALPVSPFNVGVIGAGSFASRILMPGLVAAGFRVRTVSSASGLSARGAADRLKIEHVATVDELLNDERIGVVAIATRHDSHAALSVRALDAGKAVFVEKPPCLNFDELEALQDARARTGRVFTVGFNRRHAPLALRLREHVRARGHPVELLYRVNADRLAWDHWLQDLSEGGGRLLGEGCHFVDFACWLVGALPATVACVVRPEPGQPLAGAANFTVTLAFGDGSGATIVYLDRGAQAVRKEYIEAHAGGASAVLDDFSSLKLVDPGGRRHVKSHRGNKGHRPQLAAFRSLLQGAVSASEPDPLATMGVTLAALRAAETGGSIALSSEELGPAS